MTQYRQVPVFEQSLAQRGTTQSSWYRYFQEHDLGQPPGAEMTVTVLGSPFVYQAPRKGLVIVNGGTVSAVNFARSGPYYTTGQTNGIFPVSFGDRLQIIFSVKPSVLFAPA